MKVINNNHIQNKKDFVNNKGEIIPEQYKKAAESFEEQFAKLMLDQMRKTITKDRDVSTSENIYEDLLYSKRAQEMTKNEGLGLQNIFLDQVYPTRMRKKVSANTVQNYLGEKHE